MTDSASSHLRSEDVDLVVSFATHLLSPQEERQVLARARQDEDFEAALLAACKEHERAILQPPPSRSGRSTTRMTPRRVGVATALAAGLALVLFWPRGDAIYWMPVDGDAVAFRSGPTAHPNLARGLDAYEARDAVAVIGALNDTLLPEGARDLANLYLASAWLNQGDPTRAWAVLEPLDVDTLPVPWRDRGRWLAYQNLQSLDRTEDARGYLTRLANSTGPLAERAQAELGRE